MKPAGIAPTARSVTGNLYTHRALFFYSTAGAPTFDMYYSFCDGMKMQFNSPAKFFFLLTVTPLLLCLATATATFGQFNDSTNYYIRQNSTGTINKTNDRDSYVLNNALRFSLYKKSISLNSNNSWIYGKQQDELTNNDFTSTLDFDVYKARRSIYYWGLLNFEKSYSLAIDHRFQGGVGIGYYILDREDFVLQISDGILYESSGLEERGETPGVASRQQTVRNSFRFKVRYVFRESITIDHIDYLQHSLEDRKDYILRSNTIVAIKLYKWVSLSLTVNYNKLGITDRENLLLNYGVLVERYF